MRNLEETTQVLEHLIRSRGSAARGLLDGSPSMMASAAREVEDRIAGIEKHGQAYQSAPFAAGEDRDAQRIASGLGEIKDGAAATLRRVNDISAAASEQNTASQEIARNVERIAQMSEETGAAIAQASEAAQRLAALAGRLHANVAQFRT